VLPWLILRLAAGLERHTEDTIKSWECLAEYLPRSGGDANMS